MEDRTRTHGVRLLTVAQAARQAGVNPRTIRRWCDEGILPCVRVPVGERNPPPGRSFPPGTTPYERRIDPDDLAQVVAGTATTATRWDSRTVIRLIRDLDHALAETGGFLDDDHLDTLTGDDIATLRSLIGGFDGDGGLRADLLRIWTQLDAR